MAAKDFYFRALNYDDERLKRTFDAETNLLFHYIKEIGKEKSGIVKVLDVGCGNGRTMRNIARKIRQTKPRLKFHITGIDSNPDKLVGLSNESKLKYVQGNIIQETKLPREGFDLVYSSYNTVGCIQDGKLEDFIAKMIGLTARRGIITNITWNRRKGTTNFLKQYYEAIGFNPFFVFDDLSVCVDPKDKQVYRFNRVGAREISNIYYYSGVNNLAMWQDIGPLWEAVGVVR